MAKDKVLKDVAREIGRWFLSDRNSVDSFKTFIPERLYALACEHRLPRIQVDFVNGIVTPTVFMVDDVQKSVTLYAKALPRLVESFGGRWETVRAAGLELVFDLAKDGKPDGHPSFKCSVRILDDRGVRHVAKATNWCR